MQGSDSEELDQAGPSTSEPAQPRQRRASARARTTPPARAAGRRGAKAAPRRKGKAPGNTSEAFSDDTPAVPTPGELERDAKESLSFPERVDEAVRANVALGGHLQGLLAAVRSHLTHLCCAPCHLPRSEYLACDVAVTALVLVRYAALCRPISAVQGPSVRLSAQTQAKPTGSRWRLGACMQVERRIDESDAMATHVRHAADVDRTLAKQGAPLTFALLPRRQRAGPLLAPDRHLSVTGGFSPPLSTFFYSHGRSPAPNAAAVQQARLFGRNPAHARPPPPWRAEEDEQLRAGIAAVASLAQRRAAAVQFRAGPALP